MGEKPRWREKEPAVRCGLEPRESDPTTLSSISGSPFTANRRFRSSVTVWKDCASSKRGCEM